MSAEADSQIHLIVVAAGIGSRFQAGPVQSKTIPKQYALLDAHPVLWHTLQAFADSHIDAVTVVLHPDDEHWDQLNFSAYPHPIQTCQGGQERHDSVRNGLLAMADSVADANPWVLVHDAARPCVSSQEIEALISACQAQQQGGLLVKPLTDTIKFSTDGQHAVKTINRDELFAALTPQMFRRQALLQALTVFEAGTVTDEASAMEAQGSHPLMIHGSASNIKITNATDLDLARFILQQQGRIVGGMNE